MRFYAVGNMYLSSIQQGIQAAHCLGEIVVKYGLSVQVQDFLHNHKTIVCLNGGNTENLTNFYKLLDNPKYPFAKFHEDDASLGGVLTCVGIIIPETLYSSDIDLKDPDTYAHITNPWELELVTALKRMPLAR